MKRSRSRSRSSSSSVTTKVKPFAKRLAADLGAIVGSHVDGVLERAHAYTVERVRSELAPPGDDCISVKPPPRTVAPKTTSTKPAKVAGKPSCSKCGLPGHNSRSCNKQTAVAANGEPPKKRWSSVLERTRQARNEIDEQIEGDGE